MEKFRYLHIRDGFQKGAEFSGYATFGYWTVEHIIDDSGTDVVRSGLFLEPNTPKSVTVIIKPVSMNGQKIKPIMTDLPTDISYTVDPVEFDPDEIQEFKVTFTSNTTDTKIYTTKVSGSPLPARTLGFNIYCSFGWTVGTLWEVGWDVGTLVDLGSYQNNSTTLPATTTASTTVPVNQTTQPSTTVVSTTTVPVPETILTSKDVWIAVSKLNGTNNTWPDAIYVTVTNNTLPVGCSITSYYISSSVGATQNGKVMTLTNIQYGQTINFTATVTYTTNYGKTQSLTVTSSFTAT